MKSTLPNRELGLLTASPDRMLLVQAATRGLDFVILDAEGTGLGPQDCADAVATLSGHGTRGMVRIPDLAPDTILAYANSGVDELVLPQVRTMDEVEAAHAIVTPPPNGHRPQQVTMASRFGLQEPHVAISVLVETVEAVELSEQLATSDLIDSAWLGPTDLTADLLRHGGTNEDVDAVIDEVVSTFRRHRKGIGLPARDVDGARRALARGADRCAVYWEVFVGQAMEDLARSATSLEAQG